MPDFNLDNFKKTWQQQEVQPKYASSDILEMLNKKSRNYVKYILWISVVEFIFFLAITIFYFFKSNETSSFLNVIERLGVNRTEDLEKSLAHLYYILKIISLLVPAFFVIKFYQNYRKINVESNLKKFNLQIIQFRKTVNLFVMSNILLMVAFVATLTLFAFKTISEQNIHLDQGTLIGFIMGAIFATFLCVLLIWLYYRIVYGIIIRRLGKNLKQLQEIEGNE